MKVLDKIINFIKPFKIAIIAILFGVVLIILVGNLSNSNDSHFDEIRNIPRSNEKNLENQKLYSDLTDIYDFTKQSIGIDVSEWQGDINFYKVKESGIEFVMIRTGLRTSDTQIEEDVYFKRNIKKATDAGLEIGLYFFSTADNEIEALEEAKWVVDLIKDYKITYPIAYDIENIGEFSTTGITKEQLNKNAKVFLDYVSNNGYVGTLYSSANDLNRWWDLDYLKDYMVWMAHYTTLSDYSGNYVIWQYSSEGKIKGISGNVDLNVAYFSYIGE
ncbi:MAG: glycoside hydrolase family 25 protein [Bacilli bacterium]